MLGQGLGGKREGAGPVLARVLGAAASAVGGGLADRLRTVVDDVLEKAASLGLRAATAAALFVAAVVLLLTGIKEGLVALGVPDWAASLGLALAGGLGGWLVLRRKSAPPAETAESAPGLTLRIVREERRSRPPADPVVDVHPAKEGWEVSAPRRRRGPGTFRTKEEALRAARRATGGRAGGRIVVHRADGKVQRTRRRPPS